jgi:TRAP-type C4-dicarboxylate transport system substrate-binding protein
MRTDALVLLLVLGAATAGAEPPIGLGSQVAGTRPPLVLRFASMAPEGTTWARELRAYAHDVERSTDGVVAIKWYTGGVAGDELAAIERVRRGQLDGVGATVACARLSPSLAVLEIAGIVQSHDEAAALIRRLQPDVESEMLGHGFTPLYISGAFGNSIVFTRAPVHTFDELRATRLWVWNIAEGVRAHLAEIGLSIVPLPIERAAPAFDDGQLDGFVAIPSAALAFQWSAQARFFLRLPAGFLPGCVLVATRALDRLPPKQQDALRAASARFGVRLEELGRRTDDELLGGLFERQGLVAVEPGEALRSEYFRRARAAREHLVSPALLTRVLGVLADYRAEHDATPPNRTR